MNLHRVFKNILEAPEVQVIVFERSLNIVANTIPFTVRNQDIGRKNQPSFVMAFNGTGVIVDLDEDALIAAIIEAQQGKTADQIISTFREKGFEIS